MKVDTENTDPKYWEALLKKEGLSVITGPEYITPPTRKTRVRHKPSLDVEDDGQDGTPS